MGLQLTLIFCAVFLRFYPKPQGYSLQNDIKAENLGFYACLNNATTGKYELALDNLVPTTIIPRPAQPKMSTRVPSKTSNKYYLATILLIISGDISENPGPIKNPAEFMKNP